MADLRCCIHSGPPCIDFFKDHCPYTVHKQCLCNVHVVYSKQCRRAGNFQTCTCHAFTNVLLRGICVEIPTGSKNI